MFLALNDIKKTMRHLFIPHKGIVVDNDDPLKLKRIKCVITDILNETDVDSLPWVYQHNGSSGSTTAESCYIPSVGDEVTITFPYNDIYFPFYSGSWASATTKTTEFDTGYPNVYGWKDSKGNIFKVNIVTSEVQFTHFSGTYLKLTTAGKVTVHKGAENLTDLIHQLCTASESITVLTGIGTQPVLNKATFTALKAKIGDFVE